MTDLSGAEGPRAIQRVSMPVTAGNLVEVDLPDWCRAISLQFFQSDDDTDTHGWILESGTDGAAKGNDFFKVRAGETLTDYPVRSPGSGAPALGTQKVYLACGTASGFAHLLLQEAPS